MHNASSARVPVAGRETCLRVPVHESCLELLSPYVLLREPKEWQDPSVALDSPQARRISRLETRRELFLQSVVLRQTAAKLEENEIADTDLPTNAHSGCGNQTEVDRRIYWPCEQQDSRCQRGAHAQSGGVGGTGTTS